MLNITCSKSKLQWDITLHQSGWTSSKKSTNYKCCRGCGEKGTFLQCWRECKLIQPLWSAIFKADLLMDNLHTIECTYLSLLGWWMCTILQLPPHSRDSEHLHQATKLPHILLHPFSISNSAFKWSWKHSSAFCQYTFCLSRTLNKWYHKICSSLCLASLTKHF